MFLPNIQTAEQVTDEQILYLTGIAQTLSTQNDFTIQNFADATATSPDAQQVLQSESAISFLDQEPPHDVAFDIFNPTGNQVEVFALSLSQENSIFTDIWSRIKSLFSNLRRKVKRIFCKVVDALSSDKDLDLKTIIKQVLLALIPAFAASTGLLPVALPIVISLAALLLKYGVSKVCPV